MNIKFADERSHTAFCSSLNQDANVPKGERTFGDCILSLMRWCGDSTATIAIDSWPDPSGWPASFTFSEVYPDGKRGIFGGIVCHVLCKDGKPTGLHYYGTHT